MLSLIPCGLNILSFFSCPLTFHVFPLIFLAKLEMSRDLRCRVASARSCLEISFCRPASPQCRGDISTGRSCLPSQDSAAAQGTSSLLRSFDTLLFPGKRSGGSLHNPCLFADTWSRFLRRSMKELLPRQGPEVALLRGQDTLLGRLSTRSPAKGPAPALLLLAATWSFHNPSSNTLYPEHLAEVEVFCLSYGARAPRFAGGGWGSPPVPGDLS